MSLTRQKEILDYIETICHRDSITIVDLLTDAELKKLIDDDQLDGPQKSNRIREILKGGAILNSRFLKRIIKKPSRMSLSTKAYHFHPHPNLKAGISAYA